MNPFAHIRAWRHRRDLSAELSRLDDRTLHDVGIPRWRIADIAQGAPVEARLVL
jgi:uncharacterized protein YjiS (DUF1127 family)